MPRAGAPGGCRREEAPHSWPHNDEARRDEALGHGRRRRVATHRDPGRGVRRQRRRITVPCVLGQLHLAVDALHRSVAGNRRPRMGSCALHRYLATLPPPARDTTHLIGIWPGAQPARCSGHLAGRLGGRCEGAGPLYVKLAALVIWFLTGYLELFGLMYFIAAFIAGTFAAYAVDRLAPAMVER